MELVPANDVLPFPRTERGRRTRDAILRVAEDIFAEKGFHAAAISDFTTAANLGAGTFYLYFPDKLALFRAVLDKLMADLRDFLRRPEGAHRLDREREGLRDFIVFARTQPRLFRMVQESYIVDPAIHSAVFESIAASYARRLSAAQGRGEIAAGDPDVQAWCLIAIGNFIGMRYSRHTRRDVDVDAIVETVGTFITEGLSPKARHRRLPGILKKKAIAPRRNAKRWMRRM